MAFMMPNTDEQLEKYTQFEYQVPFQGYRRYVAYAYIGVNTVGFIVNLWVLYMVAPLLCTAKVKVPKSILFYIMTLCVSDLMIMIGMMFLITEIVLGTWKFSTFACVAYLVFEAMNKFVAPVILLLISRACYVSVCLGPLERKTATSLKFAVLQVSASMLLVMVMLWPVFTYSQVSSLYFRANTTARTVNVLRKCSFTPPPGIELGFGVVSCIASYAIPLGGMIYWYVSVPFFLKKHALKSLVSSSSNDAVMRRVIATVLVLTIVYVACWSPYWLSIFMHKFIQTMSRKVVIASYFIHLLPFVSCSAYPVIFTMMNRGIKTAHAELVLHKKRRVKTLAGDASHHLRAVRSHLCLSSFEGRGAKAFNERKTTVSYDLTVPENTDAYSICSLQSAASRNPGSGVVTPPELPSARTETQTTRVDSCEVTFETEGDALL